MKKAIWAIVAIAAVALIINYVQAGSTKVKTKEMKSGDVQMKVKTKSQVPVGGKVLERDVIFHDYDTRGGGTIYVIKDEKLVMMPTKNFKSWRTNPLEKKSRNIKITMTYDPELLTYVVTDAK